MSEEQRQKIASLAAVAHDKRQRLQMLGAMNLYGLTPEQAQQRSMDYAVARAELNNAQSALDAAIHRARNE